MKSVRSAIAAATIAIVGITTTAIVGITTTAIPASAATADMAISLSESADPVAVDGSVTYTVTMVNLGPGTQSAYPEVRLSGQLGDVTFSSAASCDYLPPTFFCFGADLAPGESITADIAVEPSGAGTITASARVVSSDLDPDTSNNRATQSTTVTDAQADLAVALDAAPGPLLTSRIDYDLTAANQGPADLANATIEVQLPAQTSSVSNLSAGCSYDSSDDMVRCTTGVIANGTDTVKSFQANLGLLSVGPVPATASIASSSPADPNAANNTSGADCTVLTSLIITCT